MRRLALAASLLSLAGCPTPAERGDTSAAGAPNTAGSAGAAASSGANAAAAAGAAGEAGKPAGNAGTTSTTLPAPSVTWAIRKGLGGDEEVRAITTSGSQLVTASAFLGQLAFGGACGPIMAAGTPGTAIAAFDDAGVAAWCVVAARGVPAAIDAAAGGDIVVGGATVGGLFVPPVSQASSWVEPKGDGPYVLFIENRLARGALVFPSSGANAAAGIDGVGALLGGAIVAGHLRGNLQLGTRTLTSSFGSAFLARVDSQANDVGWSRHVTAKGVALDPPSFAQGAMEHLLAVDCGGGEHPIAVDDAEVSATCPGAVLLWFNTKGTLTRTRTLTGRLGGLRVAVANDHTVFVTGTARGLISADGLSDDGPLDPPRWVVASFDASGAATGLRSYGALSTPTSVVATSNGVVVGGATTGELFVARVDPPGATAAFVVGLDAALSPAWALVSHATATSDVHGVQGVAAAAGATFVGATAKGAMQVGGVDLLPLGGTDLVFAKLAP